MEESLNVEGQDQPLNWETIDLYEDTGLFRDDFEDLLKEITPLLENDSRRKRHSSSGVNSLAEV